eukprot:TRINITY_DN1167_c0_g3_i1.p1 TRINITY_DN1167_c0_g3~~TRINITY_DN1167_c0_g3_i1.p1  ORF type:complete len:1479 (-),score=312.24 TRINITY_DN1167_c0_g3_i1:5-4441(-)
MKIEVLKENCDMLFQYISERDRLSVNSRVTKLMSEEKKYTRDTDFSDPYYWTNKFYSLIEDDADPALVVEHLEDFAQMATNFGRIIISEKFVPYHRKTIKSSSIGGVAGGEKYIVSGIFFKFAHDVKIGNWWIYGGDKCSDEGAIKGAGHEGKGIAALFGIDKNMRIPLHCVIDYRGFRLTALSLLPVENLVYGSADGAKTLFNGKDDEDIQKIVEKIAFKYNLKEHPVKETSTSEFKDILLAADVEIHRGKDGKIYALDFARLFPPEAPSSETSMFYNLFRKEFMQKYSKRLSADAFSGFGRINAEEHNDEILAATQYLKEHLIPQFVEEYVNSLQRGNEIRDAMHLAGINMRNLGQVRRMIVKNSPAPHYLIEMIARTIKKLVQNLLRRHMVETLTPADAPYRSKTAEFLNHILNSDFWSLEDGIKRLLEVKYPGCLTEQEKDKGFHLLPGNKITLSMVFKRLSEISEVKIPDSVIQDINEHFSFTQFDVFFEPVTRSLDILDKFRVRQLLAHSSNIINIKTKMRILDLAHQHLFLLDIDDVDDPNGIDAYLSFTYQRCKTKFDIFSLESDKQKRHDAMMSIITSIGEAFLKYYSFCNRIGEDNLSPRVHETFAKSCFLCCRAIVMDMLYLEESEAAELAFSLLDERLLFQIDPKAESHMDSLMQFKCSILAIYYFLILFATWALNANEIPNEVKLEHLRPLADPAYFSWMTEFCPPFLFQLYLLDSESLFQDLKNYLLQSDLFIQFLHSDSLFLYNFQFSGVEELMYHTSLEKESFRTEISIPTVLTEEMDLSYNMEDIKELKIESTVKSLNMKGCLQAYLKLPNILKSVPLIETLNVSQISVDMPFFQSLQNCTNLVSLDLTDCICLDDDCISMLKCLPLKDLRLRGCAPLTKSAIESVCMIETLEILDVSYLIQLKQRDFFPLLKLNNIQDLSLAGNSLSPTFLELATSRFPLRRLDLLNIGISNIDLIDAENIKELHISHCIINPSVLKALESVNVLVMEECDISTDSDFGLLRNLTELRVNRCTSFKYSLDSETKITAISLSNTSGCDEGSIERIVKCSPLLEELDLSGCLISTEISSFIGSLKNLTKLTVKMCTGFSVGCLYGLKLKYLDMRGVQYSTKIMEEFLPKCNTLETLKISFANRRIISLFELSRCQFKHLNFDQSSINSKSLASLILMKCVRHLEYIYVETDKKIKSYIFGLLGHHCRFLKDIGIPMELIEDADALRLAKGCPYIKKFSFKNLKISSETAQQVLVRLRTLKYLELKEELSFPLMTIPLPATITHLIMNGARLSDNPLKMNSKDFFHNFKTSRNIRYLYASKIYENPNALFQVMKNMESLQFLDISKRFNLGVTGEDFFEEQEDFFDMKCKNLVILNMNGQTVPPVEIIEILPCIRQVLYSTAYEQRQLSRYDIFKEIPQTDTPIPSPIPTHDDIIYWPPPKPPTPLPLTFKHPEEPLSIPHNIKSLIPNTPPQ